LIAWIMGYKPWSFDEPLLSELFWSPSEWGSLPYEGRVLLNRVAAAVGALVPELKERCLRFWDGLKELHLAFECKGVLRLLPEVRRIIPEVINVKIMEFSRGEELVRDLGFGFHRGLILFYIKPSSLGFIALGISFHRDPLHRAPPARGNPYPQLLHHRLLRFIAVGKPPHPGPPKTPLSGLYIKPASRGVPQ